MERPSEWILAEGLIEPVTNGRQNLALPMQKVYYVPFMLLLARYYQRYSCSLAKAIPNSEYFSLKNSQNCQQGE
jgi:hypothetical protein